MSWTEYPVSSKFHEFQLKTYFIQFTAKFLKFEEIEYLRIHYVKFKMWPALFYINSQFSQFIHRLKIKILECWCYLHSLCIQKLKTGIFGCCSKLDFPIFPNSLKRWKIEIFKCWPIGSTSKVFQILKEIENWDDWVFKRNHQMNKKEWKLEVDFLVLSEQ